MTTKSIEQRARDYSRSFNYSLQAEDHYLAGARAEIRAFKERVLEKLKSKSADLNFEDWSVADIKQILEDESK